MVTSDLVRQSQNAFVLFCFFPTFGTFCVCRCSPQTPLHARRPFRPASTLRARRGLVSRTTSSWWTLCVAPALPQICRHLTLKSMRS